MWVRVATGTYYENISIIQKDNIHVLGSGVDVTVIDGNENGHVVLFNYASGSICEFTITNSGNNPGYSAGIFTSHSNVEVISNNIVSNCFGLFISNESDVDISMNEVVNNNGFTAINFSSSNGLITHNIISHDGYGLYTYFSYPNIINNTLIGNNNFYGLFLDPIESQYVHNNIVMNFEIGIFIQGGEQSTVSNVDIAYNDVLDNSIADYWEEYGPISNPYSQPFIPQPGTGEIHLDPVFVNPNYGDYNLQSTSPCIDAGDPNLPFDPDNTIADIGAYYFHQNNDFDDNEIVVSNLGLNIYPNPFNPDTTISFGLPDDSRVEITIYNIKGQKVKTLINEEMQKGKHSINWYGDDESGNTVSSGVYLYKLKVKGKTKAMKKCLLLK